MSNLDNLTQKILGDAKRQAEAVMAEAAQRNEGIVSSRVREANDKKKRIVDRAALEASTMKDRAISNAELKVRDEILKAKQEIMDRVFRLAKDRLMKLDEDKYIKFLENAVKRLSLKGSEMLVLPEAMKNGAKALDLPIRISEDTVESGFLLKDKDIIINYTFDSLVDYLREELEVEIALELFKG